MRLTPISGLPLAMAAACAHGIDLEVTPDFGAGGQFTGDAAGGRGGAGVGGEPGGIAGTGGDDGFDGAAGSGNAGFGGLAGSAGQANGGNAGTLATTGSGGAAGGRGGAAGGAGRAGAGGTGGAAGAGGAPDAGNGCGGNVIPVRTDWVATAALNDALAPLAVDADMTTRYTTGKDQAGGEWFQVDLTAAATINTVQLFTSSGNDYPAHWQVRFGATSMNFAAPVLIEGDGTGPNIVIHFPSSAIGRYLLISQTGTKTFWWSIHDLDVLCM